MAGAGTSASASPATSARVPMPKTRRSTRVSATAAAFNVSQPFAVSTGCLFIVPGSGAGGVTWGRGATRTLALEECRRDGYTCDRGRVIGGCVPGLTSHVAIETGTDRAPASRGGTPVLPRLAQPVCLGRAQRVQRPTRRRARRLARDDAAPRQEGPPAPPGGTATAARQPLPPPASPPSPTRGARCGAVAYTADGAFGAAYGMENCGDAERLADRRVQARVDRQGGLRARGGDPARPLVPHSVLPAGNDWTTHVTSKPTLAEVNRDATEWAQNIQVRRRNCRMVPNGLFHSGGLHTKM